MLLRVGRLAIFLLMLALAACATNSAPENRAPVANAGTDQTVAVGAEVSLDASDSSDPDGDSLSYAWNFEAKPAASTAALNDPESVRPSFAADVVGDYLVVLAVSDGENSASDSVTITATEAGQPVTEGVLLEGAPDTLAADAAYDLTVPAAITPELVSFDEAVGNDILRTEIDIEFVDEAIVEEVNAVLEDIGGRIVSMVRNTPTFVVRIPDPGSVDELNKLIEGLESLPLVKSVLKSLIVTPDADLRPQAFPNDLDPTDTTNGGDIERTDHQLAVRAHAAWNLKDLLPDLDERPWLVIGDWFGDGEPDGDYSAATETDDYDTTNSDDHGYHVLGIALGAYGPSSGNQNRDDVTGIFPGTLNVRAADFANNSTASRIRNLTVQRVNDVLDVEPNARIIVNTSLEYTNPPPVSTVNPDARRWINLVRDNDLEDRFIHLTAAGNGGSGAQVNVSSRFTYASLGNVTDTDGTAIANLTNILVIENRVNTLTNGLARPAPGCASSSSTMGGDLSAIGNVVWSLGSGNASGGASNQSGTSMATPQVAGLAAYVWSLDTDLTPQEVMTVLTDTARDLQDTTTQGNGVRNGRTCNTVVPQPVIDAFDAVLAAGGNEARTALVNISGGMNTFDEFDLTFFLNDLPGTPTLDYGRLDLNGDGVTDGDLTLTNTDRLDLDNDGAFDTLTKTIGGQIVQFDEAALTDMDIMCYYAYDSLYTGSTWRRGGLLPSELLVGIAGPKNRYVPVKFDASNNPSIEDVELSGWVKGPACTTPIAVDPAKLEWLDVRDNLLETGPQHTVTVRDLTSSPFFVLFPRTVTLRYEVEAQTVEAQVTVIPCVTEGDSRGYPACPVIAVEELIADLEELMDFVDIQGIVDIREVLKELPDFDPCDPRFCDPPEFPYDQATLREGFYGDRGLRTTEYLDRLFKTINAPTYEEFETQLYNLQVAVAAEEEISVGDRKLLNAAFSVVLASAEFFAPYDLGGRNGWRAFDFADDPNNLVERADILAPAQASLEGFLTAVVSTNTRSEFTSELMFSAASYAAAHEALDQARLLTEEGF